MDLPIPITNCFCLWIACRLLGRFFPRHLQSARGPAKAADPGTGQRDRPQICDGIPIIGPSQGSQRAPSQVRGRGSALKYDLAADHRQVAP